MNGPYSLWRCYECGSLHRVTDRYGAVLKDRFGTILLCLECEEDYNAIF